MPDAAIFDGTRRHPGTRNGKAAQRNSAFGQVNMVAQ